MARASEIVGRSLVIRDGGQAAGKIKDVVVDGAGQRVLGFVVTEGLFKSTRVAPWAGVQAIGPDSVILVAESSIVKMAEAPDIESVLGKNLNIKGVKVQTTAGKDLGEIDDVEFDDQTGAVVGYALSGGLFADVFGGRSFLPTPASVEFGKDVAFVPPEAEETVLKRSEG